MMIQHDAHNAGFGVRSAFRATFSPAGMHTFA